MSYTSGKAKDIASKQVKQVSAVSQLDCHINMEQTAKKVAAKSKKEEEAQRKEACDEEDI